MKYEIAINEIILLPETNSPSSYCKKYIYTSRENLSVTLGQNENLLITSVRTSIYCLFSTKRVTMPEFSSPVYFLREITKMWSTKPTAPSATGKAYNSQFSQTVLFPTGKSILCTANLRIQRLRNFLVVFAETDTTSLEFVYTLGIICNDSETSSLYVLYSYNRPVWRNQ